MTALVCEVVREDAALRALAPAWADLWRRVPDATPFQHPAWLLPWWEAFGTSHPRVAVLRDATNALVGLLALYELPDESKVLPMGAGLSDYQDALIASDAPPDAAARLLQEALRGCALPCHLIDIPQDAALRHTDAPAGWVLREQASDPCPVLREADIPARQRRKLRMARHRAERVGGWRVDADDPATLFEALVALHGACWRERGGSGVLADPRVLAFHRAAIPGLLAAGLLRIEALRLGGAIAAVIYTLSTPGRRFLYLSGYDPARAFESPGTLLLGAVAESGDELHMLRGGERYKYDWGAADRWNVHRLLTPR